MASRQCDIMHDDGHDDLTQVERRTKEHMIGTGSRGDVLFPAVGSRIVVIRSHTICISARPTHVELNRQQQSPLPR